MVQTIKIRGLKKIYESDSGAVKALENVDLDVKKGEIYGIIGLSGAGKSTLVRCINLLERPTEGSIEIDGTEVTELTGSELRKLRSSLGMIFQHFNLLSQRTVERNISFPLEIANIPKKERKERVLELLDLVGLSDKRKAYASQLSGGQKQRVAIARALANNPKVLLCDEATSALDPSTTKSILELLKDINQKLDLTIVIITHEMAVIKEICDNVAVIEDNQIVEAGPVIEVVSSPKTEAAKKLLGYYENALPAINGLHQNKNDFSIRIKVTFKGQSALKPVISNIARQYQIDANILSGNIGFIKGEPLGNLVLELSGKKALVEKGLDYLNELSLKYEVVEE